MLKKLISRDLSHSPEIYYSRMEKIFVTGNLFYVLQLYYSKAGTFVHIVKKIAQTYFINLSVYSQTLRMKGLKKLMMPFNLFDFFRFKKHEKQHSFR